MLCMQITRKRNGQTVLLVTFSQIFLLKFYFSYYLETLIYVFIIDVQIVQYENICICIINNFYCYSSLPLLFPYYSSLPLLSSAKGVESFSP